MSDPYSSTIEKQRTYDPINVNLLPTLYDKPLPINAPPHQLTLLAQHRTRARLASHQIPHPQRPIFTDAEGEFTGRMHGDRVDTAFMTFEQGEQGPVACVEERDGAVF